MSGEQWIRLWLITDTQLAVIRNELKHIEQNMIHTPDTRASYDEILKIINNLKVA